MDRHNKNTLKGTQKNHAETKIIWEKKKNIDFLLSYNVIQWKKLNTFYGFLVAIGGKTSHKHASEIKL